MTTTNQSESKNAIDKLLDIIECLYANGGKAKINTISADLGLHKSTVHRILNTLKLRGYIYQDIQDLSYGIGYKFFSVGQLFQNNYSFVDLLEQGAENLSKKYGECVQISIGDFSTNAPQHISIYRTRVNTNILSIVPAVGNLSPSHCSASGKCLLAFSENSVLERIKDCELKKYTEETITNWDDLTNELEKVKKRGWATDINELESGLSCVAVPIFGTNRALLGAMSILGASARFVNYDIEEMVSDLKETVGCFLKL